MKYQKPLLYVYNSLHTQQLMECVNGTNADLDGTCSNGTVVNQSSTCSNGNVASTASGSGCKSGDSAISTDSYGCENGTAAQGKTFFQACNAGTIPPAFGGDLTCVSGFGPQSGG